jgi:hypothetical protein
MIIKKEGFSISIILIILVGLFPYAFLFFRNIGVIRFLETATVFFILIGASLLIFTFLSLILRDAHYGAIISTILIIFLQYFAKLFRVVSKIFPFIYYWHLMFVGLIGIALIAYLVKKHMSSQNALKLTKVLVFVFIGLLVYNVILATPKILYELKKSKSSSTETTSFNTQTENNVAVETIRPNVYFFIFDEYGGLRNLKRYCDYDNSDFYDQMEKIGFASSKSSNNGTTDTMTEIPNLLNLGQLNTLDMSALEKKEGFKNPRLMTLMKEQGYSINILDSTSYFLDRSFADFQLESDYKSSFRTFDAYIWANSFIYPFYGKEDQDNERALIYRMFSFAEESSLLQENNLFTIGYFGFPHIPYVFNEYGNKVDNSDRTNLKDPIPYINQVIYANKLIAKMAETIIENDPSGIIIIQSDHGFRLATHLNFWYKDFSYDLVEESAFETDILNMVYYPYDNLDIEGLNGIETLKLVLNQILDIEIN